MSASLNEDAALAHLPEGTAAAVYRRGRGPGEPRLLCEVHTTSGKLMSEAVTLDHECLSCLAREHTCELITRLRCLGIWEALRVAFPAAGEPQVLIHLIRCGDLGHEVVLDSVIAAIDMAVFESQMCGEDQVCDLGLAAVDNDGRTISEVIARQVEAADVLIAYHADRLRPADRASGLSVLAEMGAGAPVLVPAADGRLTTADTAGPASTVMWQFDQPLDPIRVHEAIDVALDGVVRAVGHLWLATRPLHRIGFAAAGCHLTVGNEGAWQETSTTPGSQLRLVGVDLDTAEIHAVLAGCVARDDDPVLTPDSSDPITEAIRQGEDDET